MRYVFPIVITIVFTGLLTASGFSINNVRFAGAEPLKSPKADIIKDFVVTELLPDKTTREDVVYYYPSNRVVVKQQGEIKRTSHSVIIEKGTRRIGDKTVVDKFGYFYINPAYENVGDEWYEVDRATTSKANFDLQTKASFGEKLFGYLGTEAWAQSTTTTNFTVTFRCFEQDDEPATFQDVRNKTSCDSANATTTTAQISSSEEAGSPQGFYVSRVFRNIDLLGDIPTTAIVSSSTDHLVISAKISNTNGVSYATATSSASYAGVDQYGSISLASTTDTIASAYIYYDSIALGVNAWTLNSTGLTHIENEIDNNNSVVRFVARTGLDISNTSPTTGANNEIQVDFTDPRNALLIEWTEVVEAVDPSRTFPLFIW